MQQTKKAYRTYLFHFIPFITIKQAGNETKYKLFGITVLKFVSRKNCNYNPWGWRPGGYND